MHKSGDGWTSPFPRTDLSRDLCDGRAECGEAVQDRDPDLELCDLTVEVSGGQALPQQLDAVHLGFCATSAVVAAPSSPDGSTDAFRRPQDFVSRDRPGGIGLPEFGILAGRYDSGGPTGRDRVMALAGVEGTIGGDAADLLFGRDLVQQFWQHRRIAYVARSELRRSDFQGLLIDPDVDLAPDPAFCTAMLAGVPLAFALDLDAGAVDQQMQRTIRSTVGDVHLQGFLPPRQRAEVRHRPVEAGQSQQALDEPGRLPQRHPEEDLHGQAGLDCSIAVVTLSAALTGRRGLPGHRGIEPDRQRASALQRLVVARPVPGLVGRGCRSAHGLQLSRWIHDMNPLRRFVQQSPDTTSTSAPIPPLAATPSRGLI